MTPTTRAVISRPMYMSTTMATSAASTRNARNTFRGCAAGFVMTMPFPAQGRLSPAPRVGIRLLRGPGPNHVPTLGGCQHAGVLVRVIVVTLMVLAAPSCSSHAESRTSPSPPATAPGAAALCETALHRPAATAQATTLGQVRTANFGGPYPGITPGKKAFGGLAARTPAAWCWTAPAAGHSSNWDLYVAVAGQPAARIFSMNGMPGRPPTGPPTIP